MSAASRRWPFPCRILFLLILAAACATPVTAMLEGAFLYFPTHAVPSADLQAWRLEDKVIGYARVPANPKRVWLMCHGNGGQASQRSYICSSLPATDAVYILEYPGYGLRAGTPSMKSINAAALAAYAELSRLYPATPLGLIGESLGSGPAAIVAVQPNGPKRLVLIVPFDNLLSVAKEHISYLPVSLLMRDKWDNVTALAQYKGRIDIYGATYDNVIPVHHARHLAETLPGAKYHELKCGHNDWSGLLRIED